MIIKLLIYLNLSQRRHRILSAFNDDREEEFIIAIKCMIADGKRLTQSSYEFDIVMFKQLPLAVQENISS